MGWEFAEGDAFHPQANIDKMHAGTPLTDDDRWPWLRLIRDWMAEAIDEGRSASSTCSALKVSYRDVLREAGSEVRFLHLVAPEVLVGDRMAHREGTSCRRPCCTASSTPSRRSRPRAEHGSTVVSVEGTPPPGPRALHERARPLRPQPISRKVTAHESHRHLDQRLVCCPAPSLMPRPSSPTPATPSCCWPRWPGSPPWCCSSVGPEFHLPRPDHRCRRDGWCRGVQPADIVTSFTKGLGSTTDRSACSSRWGDDRQVAP